MNPSSKSEVAVIEISVHGKQTYYTSRCFHNNVHWGALLYQSGPFNNDLSVPKTVMHSVLRGEGGGRGSDKFLILMKLLHPMDLSGGAGWCTTFCSRCTIKLGSVYGQKLPQNAINRTYDAISDSGSSKLVVQGWYEAGNMWADVFGPFFHPELPSGSPRMP